MLGARSPRVAAPVGRSPSVVSALTPVLSLNPVRVERTTVTKIEAE
ncbi:hypothetical protein AGMMS49957_17000 [Synergistales bacterium]|nr:hypothetical protein AGMMS49957_17000 [Synergistales bacterium]